MSASAEGLPHISARRRRTDKIMRGSLVAGFVVAMVPLVLVVYYLIYRGISSWSWKFFTTDPNGNFLGYPGGVRSAILGSIEIMLLASAIAIPLGIGVAVYLIEYGKDHPFAVTVRYLTDVMTGVPSIVFGLFIYIVLVVSHIGGSGFAGWKGALAITLLMLPVVSRSAEVVLLTRTREPARGGPGARSATLAGRNYDRPAHGPVRSRHGLAARRRARDGRDCTAPIHDRGHVCADLQLERPDERDAAADIQRHHVAQKRDRGSGLGHRAASWLSLS